MFEFITDFFGALKSEPKDVFLLVRESKTGIETYISPRMKQFDSAYKSQLKAFLEGVLKELK